MKRVNISLKKNIHSQAKIISILKNIHLNKYLESCVEKAIKEDQKMLQMLRIEEDLIEKMEKSSNKKEENSNKEGEE